MTGYTLHRTARPALRRALDKLREWDFYSDDHEEIKTLLLILAMLIAADGLFYVLYEVVMTMWPN